MSTHHHITSPPDQPPSNRSSNAPQEETVKKPGPPLDELLAAFHATWLGEGDVNAGANLLVARAVTLSNLSRTGCGIQLPGFNRLKAGASLFVNGALSSSFVSEMVGEVAIRQNNFTAQLERLIRDKFEDARKKGLKAVEFPSGPDANGAENALFHLEQGGAWVPLEPLEEWGRVLNSPPNPRIDDLAARPKLLVTAKGPKDLEKQLKGLHGNRPLVSLSLKNPAEAASYADTCDALLGGPYPVGDCGETVMANLIVTDPGNVLARIAPHPTTDGDKNAWIGRMVWLVDGTPGPDAVETTPGPGKFLASDTGGRFGTALDAVLAKRLNNHDAGTVVHPFDLTRAQIRWVAYLKTMEGRLPGITGTARGLLATLAFGLIELAQAPGCKPPLPEVTPEGVDALGRWVIRRMANARIAMLGTAELERKRQLALRVYGKLGDGNFSKRDICRALTIPAARCEEVLAILEPTGLIGRVGREWQRLNEGPLPYTALEELIN